VPAVAVLALEQRPELVVELRLVPELERQPRLQLLP